MTIKKGDKVAVLNWNHHTGKFDKSPPVLVLAVNEQKGVAFLQGYRRAVDLSILSKVDGCCYKPTRR